MRTWLIYSMVLWKTDGFIEAAVVIWHIENDVANQPKAEAVILHVDNHTVNQTRAGAVIPHLDNDVVDQTGAGALIQHIDTYVIDQTEAGAVIQHVYNGVIDQTEPGNTFCKACRVLSWPLTDLITVKKCSPPEIEALLSSPEEL